MKPNIKAFDRGWNYIQHVIIKLISFLVISSWKYGNMSRNKITGLPTSVNWVCRATLNTFPQWISKLHIQKYKNHSKASSGAWRFFQNFQVCKKSQFIEQNSKSGQHNR